MTAWRASGLFAAVLGVVACTTPATEILVTVDTDPALRGSYAFTLDVSADRNGAAADAATLPPLLDASVQQVWNYVPDGGVRLPGTFAIVPPRDGSIDAPVWIVVRATSPVFGTMRRVARIRFVRGQRLAVRMFLSGRCAVPLDGARCSSAGLSDCTLADLCETEGRTCGDDGACVSPDMTPGTNPSDASTEAGPFTPCGWIGTPCCDGTVCVSAASCTSGMCVPCGGSSQPCCRGTSCASGFVCITSGSGARVCVPCGGHNQPCCSGNPCYDGTCTATIYGDLCRCGHNQACCAGGVCDDGTCTATGVGYLCRCQRNEPCCFGGACDEGTCAPGFNVCVCGGSGQACCAFGICDPLLCCNGLGCGCCNDGQGCVASSQCCGYHNPNPSYCCTVPGGAHQCTPHGTYPGC